MENVPGDITFTFHCTFCSASTDTKEKLEHHINEVHDNYKPFKCAICALSFENEDDVLKHIESCNEEQRLKSLKNPSSAQKEANCRDELLVQCLHCSWSFDNRTLLVKHIKLRHCDPSKKEDGKVPCPLCDSFFPSKSKLGRHYNGVHLKLRPYECQECKIKFSQRATLNKHNKDVHSPSKDSVYLPESLSNIMHDSSDQDSSTETREEQPTLSTEPEVDLNSAITPTKLIVPPKLKLKLQSPSTPKEDKHNGIHRDLKMSPINACSLCHKNFSQRSSLNRHLRCVHSLDTNKMKDKLRVTSQQPSILSPSILSPSNGSHKCFVCDVSFSKLSDLENHNADLHSDHVLSKGSMFADDRNDFSQGSVSSSEIHNNVPEAICTEEVSHESNLLFSHTFTGDSVREPLFPPRQSEAAIALRDRTDISSETATVAESLLSLPESVLPFSHPKDDVFSMKNDDDDEVIGADLKQRITELSLALEHSDTMALPSNPLASSSSRCHSVNNLDESLPYLSANKRFSSNESPENEPLRKKARRETLPHSKSEESLLPKMRSKRTSLPGNITEEEPPRTRGKMPRREISYSDNPSEDFDSTKPDDFVEGTFRCMECYTFFYCKKEFECHMDDNHRDIRPFKCSKCHSSFKSEKALDIHNAAVHEKLKPHICPKCGTGFGQKASLYRHIKEVNHDLIYCSDCNACFNVKRDLAEHINSIHSLLKPFKCEHCERSFVSKHQRHIHHLTVHEKRRPYKCDQCGAAFGQRGSLHRHMKTVDHKFLPHKCPQCIRAFRKEEDLQSHVDNDHSPNSSLNNASSRMRPYKCVTCKTSFKHEIMLQDHIQSCHSNEQDSSFSCNFCAQQFDTEEVMNAHVISHHSNVSALHQCNMCKMCFKKKKQLKKHIEYVEQNSDSLRCIKCKNLYCLSEQLISHMKEMHQEPLPSIKEERSDLENILPCSSTLFEGLDYAQSVKQNLELIVDNIKKHSPKKVAQERIESTGLEDNSIPVTLENIRGESQLVNHFSPMIKQEYAEQPPTPSNNNTYEKYLEEAPSSISQYSNSNSPGIETPSAGTLVKFNNKARFDHPLEKQYSRTVQSDVQYTVGVNPISYGDAPLHRDNYEVVHYPKGYVNHPINKPIDATNKSFQESAFIGGSNQCNEAIAYMHPKQKTLVSPYKNFEPLQSQQQLPFERKHYDRSQFILPTSEGTIHPNEIIDSDKSCSAVHFSSPVVTTMVHNNGGIVINKSFRSDNQINSMVHHAEYVDALQGNKPIDASNKTFMSTSEFIDNVANVENPMKFIEIPKDDVKNFVVTNDGEYIHPDDLKYVSPLELSNKSYHHINEMNQEGAKYVQTIQKAIDVGSKTYATAADYQVNQPMKYVEATTSNNEVAVSQVDQTIKYIEKDDESSKNYNDYPFESHDLTEAVKFVETSKSADSKSAIDKSDYYVPVTMHYLVKHVEDQPFDSESLAAYAVNVDDLKDQSKMNSMETLYAVALEDVKDLQERVVNGGNSSQQYVIIDDSRGDKAVDGTKCIAEPGAKNYALTLHLVDALEKHVNKNVGDVPSKQPVNMDHVKMYVSQNYPQLPSAGPSMENESVPKEKVIFGNNMQYVNEVNADSSLNISKPLDVNNVIMLKDQPLSKVKLNQENLMVSRDESTDHYYVPSPYMCFECNVMFTSKEDQKIHCETDHQN